MNKLPHKVKKRIALSGIFYPLDQNEKRKWGRIMGKGFDAVAAKCKTLADDMEYTQKVVAGNTILWAGEGEPGIECMICFFEDAMDLDQVESVFKRTRKYEPVFTYATVHQKKDGDGTYDIFRLSKFSYLEHCNRVKAPKK